MDNLFMAREANAETAACPSCARVIAAHVSEFPEPIEFSHGDLLEIGETYVGHEGWDNWAMCTAPNGKKGWVPTQAFEVTESGFGVASESYSAKELNVVIGQTVRVLRELNGWAWCDLDGDFGWVPLKCLDR